MYRKDRKNKKNSKMESRFSNYLLYLSMKWTSLQKKNKKKRESL